MSPLITIAAFAFHIGTICGPCEPCVLGRVLLFLLLCGDIGVCCLLDDKLDIKLPDRDRWDGLGELKLLAGV